MLKMFDDVKLPKKITPSPIAESVFEIRFESDIPDTAFAGIYLPIIKQYFNGDDPEELPILQLPSIIRKSDPSLKFQPYYRLTNDGLCMAFGPNSISFNCLAPYKGWQIWSKFFFDILKDIGNLKIFENTSITRLGLRYIDQFSNNIFDKIKLNCTISDNDFITNNTQLRTEFNEDDVNVVLQIFSGVMLDNDTIGSTYDIDCLLNYNKKLLDFIKSKNLSLVLERLHIINKRYFFGMLKEDFFDSLKPEWED